jgi:hypothetical protein
VGRKNIFKPTIGNWNLHQDSNDNGVRIVNFTIAKYLVVKITVFPPRNCHTYTWTTPDGNTHNPNDHILIERRWQASILGVRSCRVADCYTDHYLVVSKVKEMLAISKQVALKFYGGIFNLRDLSEQKLRNRSD